MKTNGLKRVLAFVLSASMVLQSGTVAFAENVSYESAEETLLDNEETTEDSGSSNVDADADETAQDLTETPADPTDQTEGTVVDSDGLLEDLDFKEDAATLQSKSGDEIVIDETETVEEAGNELAASVLSGTTKENPYELEMLNGEYSLNALYTLFGGGGATYYYGIDGSRDQKVNSKSDGTGKFTNGVVYNALKSYIFDYPSVGYFKAIVYFSPIVEVCTVTDGVENSNTAISETVTLNDVVSSNVHKIYATNTSGENNATAKLKVPVAAGYNTRTVIVDSESPIVLDANSNEIELTLKTSSKIKVIYSNEKNAKLDVTSTGKGSVSVSTGEYPAGNLPITATPDAGYYVSSVKINGSEKITDSTVFTDRSCTVDLTVENGANYTIDVVFTKRALNVNATGNVGYNPLKSLEEQISVLKQNIFNAVVTSSVPEGVTLNDVTITYKSTKLLSDEVWRDLTFKAPSEFWKSDFGYSEFPTAIGETAEIKISWPESGKYPLTEATATITLVDSRPLASYTLGTAAAVEVELSETPIIESAKAAVTGLPEGASVTWALEDGSSLPSAGETKTIRVIATIAETAEYQKTTIMIPVEVTGKIKPSTVTVNKVGNGTVTVADANGKTSADGTYFAGTITVTAVPASTYYVESITYALDDGTPVNITGAFNDSRNRSTSGTFALENGGKAYSVEVVFAERKIVTKNPIGSVAMNGFYKASEQKDALEANIFNAVVDTNIKLTDVKVEAQNDISSWYHTLDYKYLDFGTALNDGSSTDTEIVKITWNGDNRYPTVSVEGIAVTVVESRPSAVISYTGATALTFDTADDLKAQVEAKVTSTYGTPVVALKDAAAGPAEDQDGVAQTITYTAAVAGTADYVGASKDIVISATGKIHPATVEISENEKHGDVTVTDADGTVVACDKEGQVVTGIGAKAGKAAVVVEPAAAEGYYVDAVTVDGQPVTGTYENQKFTAEFDVVNGDYNNEKTYRVAVTYAKRVITEKENPTVYYNAGLEYNDAVKAEFLGRVLSAAVELNGLSADQFTVALNGEKPVVGQKNEFTITWKETDVYPEVTITCQVMITEQRTKADISTGTITEAVEVDGDLSAAVTAVEDAGVTVSEGAAEPTLRVKDGETAPKQGETKTIFVIVTVAENETYLGNTIEVPVSVVGKVHPANVNLTVNGEGSAVNEEGTALPTTQKLLAGDLKFTAVPADGCYVDTITVNGSAVAMEQVEGTVQFTATAEILDGTGLDASAPDKTYEIVVNFAKRVTAKAPAGMLDLNRGLAPSKQFGVLKNNIYNAIVQSTADTVDLNSVKYEVWGEGVTLFGYTIAAGYYKLEDSIRGLGGATAYLADTGFQNATQKVRITIPASGKYPQVVLEETLTLNDTRPESGLTNATLADIAFVNSSEVDAHVAAAYGNTAVNTNMIDSSKLTYGLKAGSALPTECNQTETVTYVISFAGDETYKPGSCEVTFKATRKAAQCEIIADSNVAVHGTITGTGTVDGLTEVTVSVKPKTSGYAVSVITVKKSDGTVVKTSAISYDSKTASVTFKTDGTNGKETYTVFAEYEEAKLAAKANPEITYCYEQDKVNPAELQDLVFKAVYDAENSSIKNLTSYAENVKIEYQTASLDLGGLGNLSLQWSSVGSVPSWEVNGVTHHFGEQGTETIRLTYEDEKYGELTVKADLTVYDACYNNTVTVVEVDDTKDGGNVKLSAPEGITASKEIKDTTYYKENIVYTVNVTPGNSLLTSYAAEAVYVKEIKVTDKDGNKVDTSELAFREGGSFIGVSYGEPVAYVTFTTGSDQDYTITVTYGVMKYEATEDAVTLNRYKGGKTYEALLPTAEEIFAAVISDASPELLETYDAEKVTVEYTSDLLGVAGYSSDLSALLEKADGKGLVRISYQGDLQYHAISVTKEVTLQDPRTATTIQAEKPATAVEYATEEGLKAALREQMNIAVMAGDTAVADAVYELVVSEPYEVTVGEGEEAVTSYYVNAQIIYDGTTAYQPSSKTIEMIEIESVPDNAQFQVEADSTKGTAVIKSNPGSVDQEKVITPNAEGQYTVYGKTSYKVEVTPNAGYAVESITVEDVTAEDVPEAMDEEGIVYTAAGTYTPDYNDQVAVFPMMLMERHSYKITVHYMEAKFDFAENAEYSYCVGLASDIPTAEEVYDAAVNRPNRAEAVGTPNIDVKYLARKAGTSVVIEIPDIAGVITGQTYTHTFNEDLWLPVDAKVTELDLEEFTSQIVNGEISIWEISSKLSNIQNGAHEFGTDGDTETIKVAYEDEKQKVAEDQTTIKIVDPRTVTELSAQAATVTYGFSKEDLLKAMNAAVMAEGAAVEGAVIEVVTEVDGLNASETPYEVTVRFAGDENYQPCEATVSVTVKKAKAVINYESQVVKYGSDYEFKLYKNPENVKTIDFMIGLDISDITGEGAEGFVQVVLPGKLGELIKVNGDMSLKEFQEALSALAGLGGEWLEGLGYDMTTVNALISILQSVSESISLPDLKIRVNGEMKPDNIGIYLAGAVTADSNYETAYTANYLVITPAVEEVTLAWDIEDANGLLTDTMLKNDWYSLGAHVVPDETLTDRQLAAANKTIAYLFFGIDAEGNPIVSRDLSEINGVGGYTQIAYTSNFGNECYYAMPLIRAFAIVPELVEVQFVDGTGAVNADRVFTYDGTPKAMDVSVKNPAGTELSADEKDAYLTVTYIGYDVNKMEVYRDTQAPTNAGAYTAVAVFADKTEETGLRYGAAVGALVIKPAEAEIAVESQIVPVNEYDGTFKVSVTPEDCKYITLFAALDVSDVVTSEGVNAPEFTVNMDLPARLDNVLKNTAPSIYENGISLNNLLAQKDRIAEVLEGLGMDPAIIEQLISFVEQLPADTELGDVTVTFKEYSEVAPTQEGVYALGAITCDPNYTVAAAAGYLVLTHPEANVELDWKIHDDNMLITGKYIGMEGADYDMSAYVSAADTEELKAAAADKITYWFIGVDTEGNSWISHEPSNQAGAYTEIAYIEDEEANIYARPIIRAYAVVPQLAKVNFLGEYGEVNPDRVFTYDGTQKVMDVQAADRAGNVLADTRDSETNCEFLNVKYLGYNAAGLEIYNSTEVPTEVGAYTVIAVYADETEEMYGMAVGAMVIKPAESEITVTSTTIPQTETFTIADMIEAAPEDLPYISVLAGVDVSGETLKLNGIVNIDFPAAWDEKLQTILGSAYTDGVKYSEIVTKLDSIKAHLEELGLSAEVIDQVIEVLKQLPAPAEGTDLTVTFKDQKDTTGLGIGTYLVGAVTASANYVPAADLGYLIIVPTETKAELSFDQELEGSLTVGEDFDFGVTVTVTDTTNTSLTEEELQAKLETLLHVTYVGTTYNGEPYSGTTAPTAAGVYEQLAWLEAAEEDSLNDLYLAVPIARTIVIERKEATLVLVPTPDTDRADRSVVYDGEAHGFTAKLTDADGNEIVVTDELDQPFSLAVTYVGSDISGEEIYNSTEAPVNVGLYAASASFAGNAEYRPALAADTVTITKRPIEIKIADDSKAYGDADPESWTWEFVNEARDLIAKDKETFALTLRREMGENIGTYAIDLTLEDAINNPNYNIVTEPGTFTITARTIEITIADQEKVYGDNDPELTYVLSETCDGLLEGDTLDLTLTREEGEDVDTYEIFAEETEEEVLAQYKDENSVPYYQVTITNGALEIKQREVTITGVTAVSREYEAGNTTVELDVTNAVIDNKLASDELGITGTASMENADAGTDKKVSAALMLTGEKASNYKLTNPEQELTVTITPAEITSVSLGEVAAPEYHKTPQTAIDVTEENAKYTAALTWELDGEAFEGTFEGGKAYTAVVTLEVSDANYKFAEELQGIDGWSMVLNADGTVSLTKTFAEIEQCRIVASSIDRKNGTTGIAALTVKNETGTQTELFYVGEKATVTAAKANGYVFKGWYLGTAEGPGNEALSTNAEYTFTVQEDTYVWAVYEALGKVKLTIHGPEFKISDRNAVQTDEFIGYYTVGTKLTLTGVAENGTFLYWKNDAEKIVSKSEAYTFTIVNDTRLEVVYNKVKVPNAKVEFVTAQSQVLNVANYGVGDTIEFPRVHPSKAGYIFKGWNMTERQIWDAIEAGNTLVTVSPVYEASGLTYTVTVKNNVDQSEIIQSVEDGKVASLQAPAVTGRKFSHWSSDVSGTIVLSTNEIYHILITGDLTFYAIYVGMDEEVVKLPTIEITDKYAFNEGGKNKVGFVITRNVPEGYSLIEHGVLYSTSSEFAKEDAEESMVIGNTNVRVLESIDAASVGIYKLNISYSNASLDKVVYARGYMVVQNLTTGSYDTIYTTIHSGSYNSLKK